MHVIYRIVPIRSARRKDLPRALLFRATLRHAGSYSVLLTYGSYHKPTPVKQVVVAAIVILSNICRPWTMYFCVASVKFL